MVDERKIGICIPTYQRLEMVLEAFNNVYDDERISEIVVCDDCSDVEIYHQLQKLFENLPKIKLFRNDTNLDCYFNKWQSMVLSMCEWNILLDSDNRIDKSYLDRIFEIENWDNRTSYMPSFASPTFSYKEFEGVTISRKNIHQYIERPMFSTMLNCMNLFINRNEYLRVWENISNPHTADSIFFNYCWFDKGNEMYVVPNLEYFHRIHDQSHYRLNQHKTNGFYEHILEKIKQMT